MCRFIDISQTTTEGINDFGCFCVRTTNAGNRPRIVSIGNIGLTLTTKPIRWFQRLHVGLG